YEAVPLLYTTAMPGGVVTGDAYQTLLTRLLDRLGKALPVDGVLLVLHGAMVAEVQDDCEAEILGRVRALVGISCPVVSVLAMHEQAVVLRQDPRVVNISIMGGFAYSDIPSAGVSVLATTSEDQALARQVAQSLADIAWQNREAARYTGIPVAEAIKRAIAAP